MLDLYFTVRSVTPGQKGRDALNAAGELVNRLKAGQTAHEQEKTPPESGGTGGIL